jgi:hypothetical protein
VVCVSMTSTQNISKLSNLILADQVGRNSADGDESACRAPGRQPPKGVQDRYVLYKLPARFGLFLPAHFRVYKTREGDGEFRGVVRMLRWMLRISLFSLLVFCISFGHIFFVQVSRFPATFEDSSTVSNMLYAAVSEFEFQLATECTCF